MTALKITDLKIKCWVCKGTRYVWTSGGNSAECRRCKDGEITLLSQREADVIHAFAPDEPVIVMPDGTLMESTGLQAEMDRLRALRNEDLHAFVAAYEAYDGQDLDHFIAGWKG